MQSAWKHVIFKNSIFMNSYSDTLVLGNTAEIIDRMMGLKALFDITMWTSNFFFVSITSNRKYPA